MAEQWEQIFKGFGEKTYTIAQLIQNVQEGDDLEPVMKEIKEAHEQLVKESKEVPKDIPDVDDEAAQAELKNAAGDIVIASNKLLASANEKLDIWRPNKELGKIINKTIIVNSDVVAVPYPASNPYSPEIVGQTKKCQSEAQKYMKAVAEEKEAAA